MPTRYRIHADRGYVEEIYEGRVTLATLNELMAAVYGDPAWNPDFHGIADFTNALIELSFDEMWSLVKFMRKSGVASRGRWAFVVPSQANYGMVRMYEALSDDLQSQICAFKTRGEALQWLGVSEAVQSHEGRAQP